MRNNHISIGDAIQAWISESGMSEIIMQSKIELNWEKIMGKLIARNTKTIEFRKGKLYITVSNSSLKQELYYNKDMIAQNVNEFLGGKVISDVFIY